MAEFYTIKINAKQLWRQPKYYAWGDCPRCFRNYVAIEEWDECKRMVDEAQERHNAYLTFVTISNKTSPKWKIEGSRPAPKWLSQFLNKLTNRMKVLIYSTMTAPNWKAVKPTHKIIVYTDSTKREIKSEKFVRCSYDRYETIDDFLSGMYSYEMRNGELNYFRTFRKYMRFDSAFLERIPDFRDHPRPIDKDCYDIIAL